MSISVNKVELTGFIGMNPKVKEFDNGNKMLRLSLATNESYKKASGDFVTNTTWHNVVMWNNLASDAAQKLQKGLAVELTGRLSNRKYTDKTGVERRITEIICTGYRIPERNAE